MVSSLDRSAKLRVLYTPGDFRNEIDSKKHMLVNSFFDIPSTRLDRDGEPQRLLSFGWKRHAPEHQELSYARKSARKYLYFNGYSDLNYMPGCNFLSWNRHNHFAFGFRDKLSLIDGNDMNKHRTYNLQRDYGIRGIFFCVAPCSLPGKDHLLTIGTAEGHVYLWDINAEDIHTSIKYPERPSVPKKHRHWMPRLEQAKKFATSLTCSIMIFGILGCSFRKRTIQIHARVSNGTATARPWLLLADVRMCVYGTLPWRTKRPNQEQV